MQTHEIINLSKFLQSEISARLSAYCLSGTALFIFIYSVASQNIPYILFNADALHPALLYKDIFIDEFPLKGWSLTPAPFFFPDIVLYFPVRFLAGSTIAGVFAFTVVQWLAMLESVFFLIKNVLPDRHAISGIYFMGILFSIIVFIACLGWAGEVFLPHFVPDFHAGMCIATILDFAFAVRYIKTGKITSILAVTVIGILTTASDQLFWISFIFPAIVTFAILFRKNNRARNSILIIMILFSGFVGNRLLLFIQDLNIFLIPSLDITERFRDSLIHENTVHEIAIVLFEGIWLQFSVLDVGGGIAFCLILILLLYKSLSSFRKPGFDSVDCFFIFALIATVSGFFALSVTRALFGIFAARYAIVSYTLPIICAAILAGQLKSWKSWQTQRNLAIGFTALFIIFLFFSISRVSPTLPFPEYRHPLAACMDEHQSKYNLKFGLADYWNAKPLNVLSQKGIRANQVYENLGPLYWMMNYYWYFGKEKSPDYDFIITERLDRDLILKNFGKPAAIFFCGQSEVFVFNRPTDRAFREHLHASREQVRVWQILTGR